jgi:epoxyqueuosine reductase
MLPEEDSWQEATLMKSCENCHLCQRACPTGAIPHDRFLLRAERCISYQNEKKGEVKFPEWIDVSWHNCIVGCMTCQRACPQNREFLQWIEDEEEFSEEETGLLMNNASLEKMSDTLIRKLQRLSLLDYLDSLPRNLGVFFNKHLL